MSSGRRASDGGCACTSAVRPTSGTTPSRASGWCEDTPNDGLVLELDDEVDEQRVLDLARGAGDVTHFSRERASLAELFREAVQS